MRASSPIWASETNLARTRERAAKPRGQKKGPSLARSRETRFTRPTVGEERRVTTLKTAV